MKIEGHVGVIGSILIAIASIVGGKPATAQELGLFEIKSAVTPDPTVPQAVEQTETTVGTVPATPAPCPTCRHCPRGTKCRVAPVPCPEAMACPEPTPCPEAQVVTKTVPVPGETITKYVSVNVPTPVYVEPKGYFEVPLSVFQYGKVGVAGGLGYVFANRWSLAGQAMYGEGQKNVETTITRVVNRDDIRTHTSSDTSYKNKTGVMLTLTIPLGHQVK